jgi:hypothetical protein
VGFGNFPAIIPPLMACMCMATLPLVENLENFKKMKQVEGAEKRQNF